VRLFNSVFKTETTNDPMHYASKGADMGDELGLSAEPPQPDKDTKNMNKVLSNLNNINAMNAGKIFLSVQKKNAALAAEYENQKAPEWKPTPPTPTNDTMTKTLKAVNAAMKEEKSKEKWFKSQLSVEGRSVLVSERFESGAADGWKAVTINTKKLPGAVKSSLKIMPNTNDASLEVTDSKLSGDVWYWSLPIASTKGNHWLGKMDAADSGTLTFELKQNPLKANLVVPSEGAADSPQKSVQGYKTTADIILHGGGGSGVKSTLAFYMNRYAATIQQPSQTTWTKYEIPLSSVKGDPTLGKPWALKTDAFDVEATNTHFADVLANLDTILIRGRYQTGIETTSIRNVMIMGCPLRCENGGTVIRDRCVCQCKAGFAGARCQEQVSFDFESMSERGQGTGMCITLCRPKLKSSFAGANSYLECRERHNTNFYASAEPIAMMTQCSGETNQLFNLNQDSAGGTRFMSTALPGYCLGVAGAAAKNGIKSIGFDQVSGNAMSVVMCSKANGANLWDMKQVKSMTKGIYRIASKERGDAGGRCMSPHISWSQACADKQCSVESSSMEVRQAILSNCNDVSDENRFYFGPSKYEKQRKRKLSGKMAAASKVQITPQQEILQMELKIMQAKRKLSKLKEATESARNRVKIQNEQKMLEALEHKKRLLQEKLRKANAEKYKEMREKLSLVRAKTNSSNVNATRALPNPAPKRHFDKAGLSYASQTPGQDATQATTPEALDDVLES